LPWLFRHEDSGRGHRSWLRGESFQGWGDCWSGMHGEFMPNLRLMHMTSRTVLPEEGDLDLLCRGLWWHCHAMRVLHSHGLQTRLGNSYPLCTLILMWLWSSTSICSDKKPEIVKNSQNHSSWSGDLMRICVKVLRFRMCLLMMGLGGPDLCWRCLPICHWMQQHHCCVRVLWFIAPWSITRWM